MAVVAARGVIVFISMLGDLSVHTYYYTIFTNARQILCINYLLKGVRES